MPLNLLKKYNDLLDLASMSVPSRTRSLKGIFERDIANGLEFYNDNEFFELHKKVIKPFSSDNSDSQEQIFSHLTTKSFSNNPTGREFDMLRSVRLHWIKYLITHHKEKSDVVVFPIEEPKGIRTYIYDKTEYYVIILDLKVKEKKEKFEDMIEDGNIKSFYLITAYFLTGKDKARNKILKKYQKSIVYKNKKR